MDEQKQKEYYRKWYAENKERVLKAAKEYHKKFPEKHNICQKKWIEKNKEHFLAYQKEFREKNAEKLKEYRRQYWLKKKEKLKEQPLKIDINNNP
jgi:hypothetical protein